MYRIHLSISLYASGFFLSRGKIVFLSGVAIFLDETGGFVGYGRTAVLKRKVPAKTGTNSKYKQIDNVKSYKKFIIFCKKSKFMLLYR